MDRTPPVDGPAMVPDPRALVSVLADETTRTVVASLISGNSWAEAVLGLKTAQRRAVEGRLRSSGLLEGTTESSQDLQFVPEVFARSLAADAARRRAEPGSFFSAHTGLVVELPVRGAARVAALEAIRARVIGPDEVFREVELNTRLGLLGCDVAYVRRLLVDFGLVGRSRDGSRYYRELEGGSSVEDTAAPTAEHLD